MDIEFHYWLTGLIAYRAGFNRDEAFTIAYSSQHVDENDVTLEIKSHGSVYKNFISQTMNHAYPVNTGSSDSAGFSVYAP